MMQVLKLPAAAGILWIRAGFALMLQQFGSILTMLVSYFAVIVIAGYAADFIGNAALAIGLDGPMMSRMSSLAFAALSPILSIGFMEACRSATLRERVTPLFLFKGFQLGRRALSSLLALGVFQVAALSVVLAFLPPGADLPIDTGATGSPANAESEQSPALGSASPAEGGNQSMASSSVQSASETPGLEAASSARNAESTTAAADGAAATDPITMQFLLTRLAALCALLAISVILWYAPMLAAWHGMRAFKAMFFSIAACWRNKAAFFLFGVGWLTVWVFALMFLGVLFTVLGKNNVSLALAAAVAMMLIGVMYCSVYITYASVFVRPALPEAPLI